MNLDHGTIQIGDDQENKQESRRMPKKNERSEGRRPFRADYREFGRRVRRLREDFHWNQTEFADKVGVSQSYVSDIELGAARPSTEVAAWVAKALNTSLDYLEPEMGVDDPSPYDKQHELFFSDEAQAAATIIDNLPPEERAACFSLVKIFGTRFEKNAVENKLLRDRMFALIEELGGRGLRFNIEKKLNMR